MLPTLTFSSLVQFSYYEEENRTAVESFASPTPISFPKMHTIKVGSIASTFPHAMLTKRPQIIFNTHCSLEIVKVSYVL